MVISFLSAERHFLIMKIQGTSSDHLLWVSDVRCQDATRTGNKAATLAKLFALGYRVPSGFCIPTDLLDFIESRATPNDLNKLEGELKHELDILGPPWVVRSSSTVEDSAALSFAGQFVTVLGLASIEDVLHALEKVYRSRDFKTVQIYAKQGGNNDSKILMAALIQRLINPICSGVVFSRHPVTRASTVVVEAVYGLCDILVDGSVTPDTLEVTPDGKVQTSHIGTKYYKSVFDGNNLIRIQTSLEERTSLSISESQILDVARLARNLESDLGAPQDVEWAIAEDGLYVLQSRPITTGIERKDQ